MPNWCTNDISIYCKSKGDATYVYNTLYEWRESGLDVNTGFGKDWLGLFLIQAGITTREDIDKCKIKCRGRLCDLWQDCEIIRITTDTAWEPMLRMWQLIIEKHFSTKVDQVLYTSTEPGCGVFYTNDEDLAGEYAVDCLDAGLSSSDCIPTDVIYDKLISFLEDQGIYVESSDMESLLKELDYLDIDYCSNKFEYVPIDDLN